MNKCARSLSLSSAIISAKKDLHQGMQSRDSCVQRETSSSITLLPTGTIKVQVKSSAWLVIYIFLLNLVSSDEYF